MPASPEPTPRDVPPAPRSRGVARLGWWLLAWASLGLGMLGIVVPGLPTVPFVLLAAFAAARGSSRLHEWLLGHARFGPMIRHWQAHGAVGRRTKWLAIGTMAVSGAVLWLLAPRWAAGIGSGIMTVIALWLWRRPEPTA